MSDDPNTPNTLPVPTDAGEIEREITDLGEQMKDTKGDYYYSEPKQRLRFQARGIAAAKVRFGS